MFGDALPYENLASTYWAMGNLIQADTVYAEAISAGGSYNMANYISRAGVFADMGRHADAVLQLDLPITRLHNQFAHGLHGGRELYAEALNDRCFERGIIGDLRNALADCAQSLSLRPGDADTLDSKAFAEYKLGRLRDAYRDETAALAKNPDDGTFHYLHALLATHLGMTGVARADMRAASKLKPDVVRMYAGYGINRDGTVGPARDSSTICRGGLKDPIIRC